MTERNEAHVAIGANWSKDPKDPEAEVARSPKCVREYPGSESDSGSASKMAENLDDERSEKVRQRMAFRRVEDEREKFRQRMALRRAEKRARQLKGRLDDATRKEVEASEKDTLKKFATCRDLREMASMAAEFDIIENEFTEEGSETNSIPIQKDASKGGGDEILVAGDMDIHGLFQMDIQKVDVDGSSGVECFHADDFSW